MYVLMKKQPVSQNISFTGEEISLFWEREGGGPGRGGGGNKHFPPKYIPVPELLKSEKNIKSL